MYARWSALLAVYLLQALAWTSLTLAASALCRRTAQALALLLSLWLGMCVIVPRLVHDLASAQQPEASQSAFASAMRARLGDVEGGDREAATTERLMQQYGRAPHG